jgi:hypothetical protein
VRTNGSGCTCQYSFTPLSTTQTLDWLRTQSEALQVGPESGREGMAAYTEIKSVRLGYRS